MVLVGGMQDASIRLSATGGDRARLAVLAGRSEDRRMVQILGSDWQSGRRSPGTASSNGCDVGEVTRMNGKDTCL